MLVKSSFAISDTYRYIRAYDRSTSKFGVHIFEKIPLFEN